jgi:hypothetical protein
LKEPLISSLVRLPRSLASRYHTISHSADGRKSTTHNLTRLKRQHQTEIPESHRSVPWESNAQTHGPRFIFKSPQPRCQAYANTHNAKPMIIDNTLFSDKKKSSISRLVLREEFVPGQISSGDAHLLSLSLLPHPLLLLYTTTIFGPNHLHHRLVGCRASSALRTCTGGCSVCEKAA